MRLGFRPPARWPALAGSGSRRMSQLIESKDKRAFLVDTLALVRDLEAQGVPSKHAEAVTLAISNVLRDTSENVARSFASKGEMHKREMEHEFKISKFKSEVQSSQEHQLSLLRCETEKLKGDIEKLWSDLRYQIDNVTAGQRLDINLERRRTNEEISKLKGEITESTTELNREINIVKTQLEAAKYDLIKYCVGTLLSIATAGVAITRFLM